MNFFDVNNKKKSCFPKSIGQNSRFYVRGLIIHRLTITRHNRPPMFKNHFEEFEEKMATIILENSIFLNEKYEFIFIINGLLDL